MARPAEGFRRKDANRHEKAYIEGRLSNLTDESIVSLYEIMDSIYMSDRTEYRGEESTEEILEKLYDVQVK